ncbi:MAG: AraC family transcriptional regulator [Anaerolineae bacterium]|nr:AraC family transcriptional regulator [Anaerolineae bacterium]
MAVVSHITFNDGAASPLGQLIVAGIVRDSPGRAPQKPIRVLDYYGLVYITDGGGHFADTSGFSQRIVPGDLVFLFPRIGHTYGPGEGDFWNEIFIIFEGPLFDLWWDKALLDPHKPILHLEPIDYWTTRFKDAVWSVPQTGPEYALVRLCRLQQLLADILVYERQHSPEQVDHEWVSQAKSLLDTTFHTKPDYENIAAVLGTSYDGFRKRFTKDVGVSPAKYYTLRRIDRACELLLNNSLTVKEIALQLGFVDEFHLSKRFKQIIGISPTGFRNLFLPR